MELTKTPIEHLLSALDTALMLRHNKSGFSFTDFFQNPGEYRPVTPRESEIWEELTHPRRHEELVRYPSDFEARAGGPFSRAPIYDRHMYTLVSKASHERRSAESAFGPSVSADELASGEAKS
jgi:hypothetical protein